MTVARCSASSKRGKPCGANATADGLCAWHSPQWAEKRRQWSARGGANSSNSQRAKKHLPDGILTMDEVRGLLGVAMRDVLAGTLEPGPANAAAAIARSYLAASEAAAVETLQAQVDELRDLM